MLTQDKQIAIVGGGPGGLTLARLLQLKGANVKVYERDRNKFARVTGSPLDMHEHSGMAALRQAGLVNEFKKNFRAGAEKKLMVNERAEIFFSDHNSNIGNELESGSFDPEIDRGPLRSILLDSLQPETVVWDSHFISMETEKEGWLLHFKNGTSAYADLIIAADGANSRIRPYITDVKALYSGVTMVEINVPDAEKSIPHIYNLLNGGKIMAFGTGRCMLGGQKGAGGIGFYASFKPDEKWALTSGLDYTDRAQVSAWFKTEYAEWAPIWHELVENTTMPVIPRPIYCMPPDQTWQALPNVTMLGDAAHVMPPFAGEGANTSMFDALELIEYLTSSEHHTLLEAISAYEISMRKRASAAAQRSLANGERMHSANALEKMLAMFSGR